MGRAEKAHRLPPLTAGGTKRFCPIEVLHVLTKIALKLAEASFWSDAIEVGNLSETLGKAKAAGVTVLV